MLTIHLPYKFTIKTTSCVATFSCTQLFAFTNSLSFRIAYSFSHFKCCDAAGSIRRDTQATIMTTTSHSASGMICRIFYCFVVWRWKPIIRAPISQTSCISQSFCNVQIKVAKKFLYNKSICYSLGMKAWARFVSYYYYKTY